VTPQARRQELAAFLRSRRQRIDPNERGFDHGRRHTPGLRREEVAALAGLSLSWYTWLEQARDVRPSPQVLTSIGRALRLDEAELEYMLRLGGHVPTETSPSDRDDPQLQALTESFQPNPASVITPSCDYVAWNRASERIVPGFLGCGDGRYNLMRFIFGGAAERNPVQGPKKGPGPLVARLRTNAARHPDDPAIAALVEELSDTSAEFARMWRLHEVAPAGPPPNVPLGHPDVGALCFQQINLQPEHHPDLTLVVFLPADAATAVGLGRLAATQ
jgi:transcriptional regulator with XRE-family HTH domain